jgi:flagellar basal-body rod protein FlgG
LTTSTTGIVAQGTKLDVLANNLANSTTDGFKRARTEFRDLVAGVLSAPGGASGGQAEGPGVGIAAGAGVAVAAASTDFRQGPLRVTSRPMDAAIGGTGFFVVEDFDGAGAYSRNGSLSLNSEGELTISGRRVQPGIAIPSEASSVTISAEGEVLATVGGAQPIELGRLQAARFINPEGLIKTGDGLFREGPASGPAELGEFGQDGFGSLVPGSLEGSNVDAAEELVDLIVSQHAFALNAQALQAADERLRLATQLRQ